MQCSHSSPHDVFLCYAWRTTPTIYINKFSRHVPDELCIDFDHMLTLALNVSPG